MQQYLQINGEQIYYYQTHPQIPNTIIFIHGNMSTHIWWQQCFPYFQNYHIIAINLRGFGKSSLNKKTSNACDFASDIIQFCNNKELKNITLIGWSFGGFIAMKVAQIKPQLVTKIVLTCSVGHLGFPVFNEQNMRIKSIQELQKIKKYEFANDALQTKNRAIIRMIFDNFLFVFIKGMSQQRKCAFVQSTFEQKNYYDIVYLLATSTIDLAKINSKWLIILGDKDPTMKYGNIEPTIKFLIQNQICHRVTIFENAGHMIPAQYTEKYVETVKQFVNS